MGWFDNLLTIVAAGETLANAVREDAQVKEVRGSKEYQEAVENYIEQFRTCPDEMLLIEYHDNYANGDGLVVNNIYTRTDPMFEAYMKVFREREIIKFSVHCEKCDEVLGYRMAPKRYEIIEKFTYDDRYKLTRGRCKCKCHEAYSWEICKFYNDEAYLSLRSL